MPEAAIEHCEENRAMYCIIAECICIRKTTAPPAFFPARKIITSLHFIEGEIGERRGWEGIYINFPLLNNYLPPGSSAITFHPEILMVSKDQGFLGATYHHSSGAASLSE